MTDPQLPSWSRREFIGGAALVAMAVGLPVAAISLSELDETEVPSERQIAMLRWAAQIVIPRTTTLGAGELGVAAFVAVALAHGLNGSRDPVSGATSSWGLAEFTRTNGTLRHLEWLERYLDRASGGDWLRSRDRQARILADLDSRSYPPGPPPTDPSPWRTIKGLMITGYYTTLVGGSHELAYEPVPGRFDPDLPITASTRSYSSDWIALEFG